MDPDTRPDADLGLYIFRHATEKVFARIAGGSHSSNSSEQEAAWWRQLPEATPTITIANNSTPERFLTCWNCNFIIEQHGQWNWKLLKAESDGFDDVD